MVYYCHTHITVFACPLSESAQRSVPPSESDQLVACKSDDLHPLFTGSVDMFNNLLRSRLRAPSGIDPSKLSCFDVKPRGYQTLGG